MLPFMKKPMMLMILDGWGYAPDSDSNAISLAKKPNLDKILANYPSVLIKTCGKDVGLPAGVMGNSEVGHLNIGAGRVVYQGLTRIDKSIEDEDFYKLPLLVEAFDNAKKTGKKVHLYGLLSDGGVHSHISHFEAVIKLAGDKKFTNLYVHPFFDGRDTAPMVGDKFLEQLLGFFKKHGTGKIGSMSGRYYAMDRDNRWDRVERAYDVLTIGTPYKEGVDPVEYVKQSHAAGKGDEFIEPVCINKEGLIQDGDTVIFMNFRSDRAREITNAFMSKDFKSFNRKKVVTLGGYYCMMEYDEKFGLPVLFPNDELKNVFGEIVSKNNLKQLRIAETEKYAHVTFFFNGGKELKFEGEDRILIDSPKEVATYDLKPEMSAPMVGQKMLEALDKNIYDVVILNFANCDMVGHTGIIPAAVKAVETVDTWAGKIIDKVVAMGGMVFLTADHGNAEKMRDEDGNPHTAHTTNDVKFVIITGDIKSKTDLNLRKDGRLADIVPTMLQYMGIKQPAEVTGKSIVIK